MQELNDYNNKIRSLIDPTNNNAPINIDGYDTALIIELLSEMIKIRVCESILAKNKENGTIGGPVHLGAGQEAVAVGIAHSLSSSDRVFGAHRSHSHLLSMNGDPFKLFAEILGKDAGYSKGMGGSMHLWNQPEGFYGSVPIVAGTVPLAVGAGLAAKLTKTKDIGVAYLGDGAIEEGIVAESMNLSSALSIPVLFVVENNLFSSHMHISERQPAESTCRFALANKIEFELVDGNDVLEVLNSSSELIERVRVSGKPAFLEAVTYRHYGHVDWREDIDVGVNRSADDLMKWKKRDPILRLKKALINNEQITEIGYEKLFTDIKNRVVEDWENAVKSDYPKPASLLDRVYE